MWKMHVLRSDIQCVKYAKIWTFSCLFFPIYNSVLIQRNTDRILSIYGKIRIRESSHFGVFFAVIRKKKQFVIKFKISQCAFVLSLNKIAIFPGGNFWTSLAWKVSSSRKVSSSHLTLNHAVEKSCVTILISHLEISSSTSPHWH